MRDYREKVKKYQNNEMSEQEAKKFEKELEDAAALFDYLVENEELSDFSEDIGSDELFKSERKVKQKVRNRIIRLIVSISIIVLLVVGGAFFLVPRIIDSVNYNPMEGQVLSSDSVQSIEEPSNFELFTRVKNQIFTEEDRLVGMSINKVGSGKYSILQEYYNDFRGLRSATKEVMDRGTIETSVSDSSNALSLIYGNSNALETDELVSEDSVLNQKIALLPDSSWVKVTLTFSEPKTWDELKNFMSLHEDVVFYSSILDSETEAVSKIGIRFVPESNNNLDSVTIMPPTYSSDFINKIENDYPGLLQQLNNMSTEDEVKQFLTSNIQYLLDHSEDDMERSYLSVKEDTNGNQEDLGLFSDQIKNSGLQFSKVQVSLPKEKFSTFVTDQDFFYVTLDDLSLFSIN